MTDNDNTQDGEAMPPASDGSTGYSPGGWRVALIHGSYAVAAGLEAPAGGMNCVCVMAGVACEGSLANALLVASAPELLGSLTELLKAIGASDIELHRHGLVAAVQRAVLAINVATNAR